MVSQAASVIVSGAASVIIIVILVGFAIANAHMLAHEAFALATFPYIFLRLAVGPQAASHVASICSWGLPLLDLAFNVFSPPSLAQLDAFFEVQFVGFILSLCGALVGSQSHRSSAAFHACHPLLCSALLCSALLCSARLGSARLGSARLC